MPSCRSVWQKPQSLFTMSDMAAKSRGHGLQGYRSWGLAFPAALFGKLVEDSPPFLTGFDCLALNRVLLLSGHARALQVLDEVVEHSAHKPALPRQLFAVRLRNVLLPAGDGQLRTDLTARAFGDVQKLHEFLRGSALVAFGNVGHD